MRFPPPHGQSWREEGARAPISKAEKLASSGLLLSALYHSGHQFALLKEVGRPVLASI